MRTFHHLPIYINKVYYFLDGCAGQYKTCKNMLNQTYHFKDFGIKETRQLFATSRGKSPWHKIGGATKIFTVKKVFNVSIEIYYLKSQGKDSGITLIFIPTRVVQQRTEIMKERYNQTTTIPETLEIFTILLNMKQKYNPKYKMYFCNIGHSYWKSLVGLMFWQFFFDMI